MKPPGIFGLYAVLVKVFGPVMWSVGVMDVLWLLAISYCIFLFAERYAGTAVAVIAAGINASWHCQVGTLHAAQPDAFLMLFIFIAYFQLRPEGRWLSARHVAAGALLGGAFWMKYNALAFLPFLLLVPYLDRDRLDDDALRVRLVIPWRMWLRRTLLVLSGYTAIVLTVLGHFWLAGQWTVLRQEHFQVLSSYGASAFKIARHYWMVPLVETMDGLGFWRLAAMGIAFLVAQRRARLAGFAPIFLGAVSGYASVAMQVRFPHTGFETCYPFFAMAWAYLLVQLFQDWKALDHQFVARGRRLARVPLLVPLAVAVMVPLASEGSTLIKRYRQLEEWRRDSEGFYRHYPTQLLFEHLRGKMQVIDYLRQQSRPGDGLYVWGIDSLIYYLTGLQSSTRFVTNFPLRSAWGPPAWREELLGDLTKSPPVFIVVSRNDQLPAITVNSLDSEQSLKNFPAFNAFISKYYQQVVTLPDFVVYHRTAFHEDASQVHPAQSCP